MEQYKIVLGMSMSLLEQLVNDYLKDGWLLSGGVAIEKIGGGVAYYQAVYKPKA